MSHHLQDAPPGAADADCAVCSAPTYYRIVVGDGHVPLCDDGCVRAWPRVDALERELRQIRLVADAALSVYRAWDLDLHHANKMFALGRALRDAGRELRTTHQVSNDKGGK